MLGEIVMARQDWQTQGITAVNRFASPYPLVQLAGKEARMGVITFPPAADGEWQFSWFEAPRRVPEQGW